jgi:hypothetical protein
LRRGSLEGAFLSSLYPSFQSRVASRLSLSLILVVVESNVLTFLVPQPPTSSPSPSRFRQKYLYSSLSLQACHHYHRSILPHLLIFTTSLLFFCVAQYLSVSSLPFPFLLSISIRIAPPSFYHNLAIVKSHVRTKTLLVHSSSLHRPFCCYLFRLCQPRVLFLISVLFAGGHGRE